MHPRLALSLLALGLLPATLPAYAKKPPAAEPKPPTYEEAVAAEQKLLENPMAAVLPQAGLQIDDEELLRVIDQADHEGRADSLPVPVAKLLSEWRQANEAKAAYEKAPWQHGPVTVALADSVTFEVPKGYKLLPSSEVAKLPQFGAEVDEGKALLVSEDDQQVYGLNAVETGHYDPAALTLHPETLKQTLDDHYQSPLMPVPQPGDENGMRALQQRLLDSPHWLQEPRYDEQQQILSWSHTQPARSPRIQALRFGRTWTVQVIATGGAEADVLLKRAQAFAGNVHFKPGQAYADAIPSDSRATRSVEDIVSGGPNPMQQAAIAGLGASMQADQERRDSLTNTSLLRIGGLVLALMAALVGAANRKKAADSKDAPTAEGGDDSR